jgi:drug/metabolite transporter (DMT)-like permease
MSRVNHLATTNTWVLNANTVGLALFAHTGFGLYVVLVKYLLDYLPRFAMLAAAFSLAVPVTFFVARRHWGWSDFWSAQVWVLCGLVAARSVSKLLAVQFTLASYVQLIDLSVPFFTPIIASLLLQESMPSRTLTALGVTGLGSFFVIAVNPFAIQLPNGSADLFGIALALVSSLMMASGVVYTRYLTNKRLNPAGVFFQQVFSTAVVYILLSLLTAESWQPFASLSASTWAVFALMTTFGLIGGGLSQVFAISRINTTLFSILLSWRLVAAVGLGWILLGERLTSFWQLLGIVIVVLTLTLYLRHQALARPQARGVSSNA